MRLAIRLFADCCGCCACLRVRSEHTLVFEANHFCYSEDVLLFQSLDLLLPT